MIGLGNGGGSLGDLALACCLGSMLQELAEHDEHKMRLRTRLERKPRWWAAVR